MHKMTYRTNMGDTATVDFPSTDPATFYEVPVTIGENTRHIRMNRRGLLMWQKGTHIQDAFPDLSADDREFLMTGITPEQWNKMFPEGDD